MQKYFKIMSFLFVIVFAVPLILFGCSGTEPSLTMYEIDISYDEESHAFSATQNVNYLNTSDNFLSELCFHIYPNAFREGAKCKPVSFASQSRAYPNGLSYGEFKIDYVKLKDQDLEFSISGEDENILLVRLASELAPNDRVEITMAYNAKLPNINHRYGYGESTINLCNFYPIACAIKEDGSFMTDAYNANGDPFYSEMANYRVSVERNKSFVLANTGEIIREADAGERMITYLRGDKVRDFALVLSDKFKVKASNVGNTKVLYYYYSDENPDKSLETSVLTMKTNNKIFGKYPYSVMSVVESNFVHGGMEYPNLVLISDDLNSYEEYTNVIVHEISHQWWYNLVGNNEYDEAWLDEGLTEFSTAYFYEENPDYGIKYSDIMRKAISNYNMFVEIYSGVFGSVDTSMNRPLDEFKTEPEYVYIAYTKGMLMFDTLRNLLGDKKFFDAIRTYFEANKYKNARTENLILAFEQAAGRSMESFFSSWIEGKVVIM